MDTEDPNIENTCKSISIELKESTNTINSKDISSESDILKLFCPDISKINEKDECDWTPLYRSIISGNLKASEVLLNHGADPNIQCSMNETALYQAVDMEKIDHVKLLLKNGSDPNISQIDGLSPLHLAVSKQNLLIIKYLLKYKANPNNQSSLYKQTPVHLAVKNNVDSSILLILVNSGGLLNIKDKFGKTPVDYINSEEMKKTIEMIKPERNNKNSGLKKIYFTPSKKSNLVISSVISKTIRSESPAPKRINKSNTITLKDSGKAKFNFIELKTGSSQKTLTNNNASNNNASINNASSNNNASKNNENINNINIINPENKENEDMNIKINLFNTQKQENEQDNKKSIYTYKRAKYYYKEPKFDNINNKFNKYISDSSKNNYNYIESPIQEESSSYLSSNKYFKNQSNFKNTNIYNATLSPTGDKKSAIKKIRNYMKSQTASQKKYIRKKSSDKISCFKCESNKKIKINKSQKIYYVNKILTKSISNKNIKNSRNIEKIYLGDITNTNNTNSVIETLTNYKTLITSNSNRGALTDRNSLFSKISYNNTNSNTNEKRPYNRPKIIIKNSQNFVKNIKEIKEKEILFKNPFRERVVRNRNKNKNLFNSRTVRNYPTYYTNKTLTSISNEQKNAIKFINNYKINNNENISFNMKQSVLSDMTDVSSIANINSKKNNYNRNSHNSSQSKYTCYTLTRNGNNSLLEIIERTNNSNIIIHDKESLPIYNWLKEIDLLIYLSIFLKKKIYSLQRTISDLHQKKVIITPNDIRTIGINIPGHVYRIFTKLELDAGLIDKKIYDYLLILKLEEEEKIKILLNKEKDGEESSQSIYECGGCNCCSLKRSHVKIQMNKKNNLEINPILNLDKWLININMYKYKQNFIKKGFDKIEFFILQMFSSIPLEEKIFEKELNIDNNNDIDMFILQLNKDVKFISNKFKKKRSSSVEMDKSKVTKYLMTNNTTENEKKIERASSYNNCSIF